MPGMNKPIYYSHWINLGIIRVQDILKENAEIKDWYMIYKLKPINYELFQFKEAFKKYLHLIHISFLEISSGFDNKIYNNTNTW